jgi:hypothetical protein
MGVDGREERCDDRDDDATDDGDGDGTKECENLSWGDGDASGTMPRCLNTCASSWSMKDLNVSSSV